MNEAESNKRIVKLKDDIRERVAAECNEIKKADNPRKELLHYVRNISWVSPELAAYLKKEASIILNLDD